MLCYRRQRRFGLRIDDKEHSMADLEHNTDGNAHA